MALMTLTSQHHSLDTLLDEILYTLTRIQAEGSMTMAAAAFESLLKECKKVHDTERSLREQMIAAEAKIDVCDDRLDLHKFE